MGDPLQAAFALPGVIAAGGSMSQPAVRGSSPSDNLYEVDFMPTGYIFHDFGASIFNRFLIQDFQLYSAGYGTSYSNATGAVFDVALRTPRHQLFKTTLDFTMLSAGIFTEGQVSENSALYFSVRKSMLPLFFPQGEELEDEDGELTGITVNQSPDDHDYQGKWVWDLNAKQQLSLSFTGAEDSAAANFGNRSEFALKDPEYQGDAQFKRGFDSQSVIWDYYGDDLQIKLGIGRLEHQTRFEYGKQATLTDGFFVEDSLEQLSYKARIQYQIVENQKLLFDAAYYDISTTYSFDGYQYVCTEIDPDCDLTKRERVQDSRRIAADNEFVGLSHIWQLTEGVETELGMQWQHNRYTGESFVLPRAAINFFVTDTSTIFTKYGQYNRQQDLYQILPVIGNPELKSQQSTHATVGFQQELSDEWSWSIEAYHKAMSDLPLALDSSQPDAALLYSNDVSGEAYGADLLINKNKTDRWYGWFSFSYAKSERTDERQQITREYFADTPMVINLVFSYQLSDRWTGGFNFTARSGQAYTPIVGVKENPDFPGRFLPIYGEPYSKRLPNYDRLDVRFERKMSVFGLDASLILEVMNIYAKSNVANIDLDYQNVHSTNDLILKEQSDDFSFRPSVGFSLSF